MTLSQFLSEVRARAEAATEGPLHLDGMTKQRWGVTARSIVDANEKEVIQADDYYLDAKEADFDLFLHAQVDIKCLVAICRELAGALEFYARGEHLMRESEPAPCNVCPPIGHHAKQALTRAAALAGKEQGRGE